MQLRPADCPASNALCYALSMPRILRRSGPSGMRWGELLNLCCSDIDCDECVVDITGSNDTD